MSTGVLLLVSALASVTLAAAGTAAEGPFVVVLEKPVPAPFQTNRDVRWAGEDSVYLAAAREGVVEMPLAGDDSSQGARRILPLDPIDWRSTTIRSIGASDRYLVAGGVAWNLHWITLADGVARRFQDDGLFLDTIADVDAWRDRLLLFASWRDGEGEWVPDGVLVRLGRLDGDDVRFEPLYRTPDGPGADAFNRCGPFGLGHARFLADGRVVVVPGVEPDIFLYHPDGRLLRTWSTDELGVQAGCGFSLEEAKLYFRSMTKREAWINQRRVIDDVLPWDGTLALLVRERIGDDTTWQVWVLEPERVRKLDLPTRSSWGTARLRGDVRGDDLVFLRTETHDPGERGRAWTSTLLRLERRATWASSTPSP